MNNPYTGHPSQVYGVEEHRLIGGKGDGMRILQVKNGLGLEFTVTADRCADISRLSFEGVNYGYFAPCGYVGPAYYDHQGAGFLKSFHAGFLTTCGLTAVGSPCEDAGEETGLHGTVGNCPADWTSTEIDDEWIHIRALVNPSRLFGEKLILKRCISASRKENRVVIKDTVENVGDRTEPLMYLYHLNMGYPLLDENIQLSINSDEVVPRNEHAAKDLDSWAGFLPPQPGLEEQCYYHSFGGKEGVAELYNPKVNRGIAIRFDSRVLDHFIQWKTQAVKDYAMGLEPGNCHADGRAQMREEGKLKFLKPGEKQEFSVSIDVYSK